MKRVLTQSMLLMMASFFLVAIPQANAENLICGARGHVVRFRLSFRGTDPSSLQFTLAEGRPSFLFHKTEMKGAHYWGKGHSPKILAISETHGEVHIRARGGIMGSGGVLVFSAHALKSVSNETVEGAFIENWKSVKTQQFSSRRGSGNPSVGARRIDLACTKY